MLSVEQRSTFLDWRLIGLGKVSALMPGEGRRGLGTMSLLSLSL